MEHFHQWTNKQTKQNPVIPSYQNTDYQCTSQPPEETNPHDVFMYCPLLHSWYKYVIRGLYDCFFQVNTVFKVSPCLNINQYFIPFYFQIIFMICIDIISLVIYSSGDGQLGFNFRLLWTMLRWTFVYILLCTHKFSFLLSIEIELWAT